jgi:hypothetical protein
MSKLRCVDVFTPNEYPKHTYVSRDNDSLEKRLRDALATPGEVVSVSGPSKSGKTVLVEKVVGPDDLITITGAGINRPEDVWDRVLNWMETPNTLITTTTFGGSGQVGGNAKGEVGIPLVAKGAVEGKIEATVSGSKAVATTIQRRGMEQVVKEIAKAISSYSSMTSTI